MPVYITSPQIILFSSFAIQFSFQIYTTYLGVLPALSPLHSRLMVTNLPPLNDDSPPLAYASHHQRVWDLCKMTAIARKLLEAAPHAKTNAKLAT